MLQNESRLQVADNSGALEILVIRCLEGSNRRYSRIGNLVVATVKKAKPHANIKKGQVVKALVVNTCNRSPRHRNAWIRFSQNYAILVREEKDELLLIGTRSPRHRNAWIRFSQNYAILVREEKDELLLIGTRIFVPLLATLEKQWKARGKKYKSFLSLAPKIL